MTMLSFRFTRRTIRPLRRPILSIGNQKYWSVVVIKILDCLDKVLFCATLYIVSGRNWNWPIGVSSFFSFQSISLPASRWRAGGSCSVSSSSPSPPLLVPRLLMRPGGEFCITHDILNSCSRLNCLNVEGAWSGASTLPSCSALPARTWSSSTLVRWWPTVRPAAQTTGAPPLLTMSSTRGPSLRCADDVWGRTRRCGKSYNYVPKYSKEFHENQNVGRGVH